MADLLDRAQVIAGLEKFDVHRRPWHWHGSHTVVLAPADYTELRWLLAAALALLREPTTNLKLPPDACANCGGKGVLNYGLGAHDETIWVPPYPCPVCNRTGLNRRAVWVPQEGA